MDVSSPKLTMLYGIVLLWKLGHEDKSVRLIKDSDVMHRRPSQNTAPSECRYKYKLWAYACFYLLDNGTRMPRFMILVNEIKSRLLV